MTRRELLQLAASAPALAFAPRPADGRQPRGLDLDAPSARAVARDARSDGDGRASDRAV